jgi:hypothetical protein
MVTLYEITKYKIFSPKITILKMEKPPVCAGTFCASTMLVFRNVNIPPLGEGQNVPAPTAIKKDSNSQIRWWISTALIHRLVPSSLVLPHETASSPS